MKHLLRGLLLLSLAAISMPAAASASTTQTVFFEAPRDLTAVGGTPATLLTRAAAFTDFQALGVKALRVNLQWFDVAPAPNDAARPAFDTTDPNAYNWGGYAATIDLAKEQGMKVLISLASPVPKWATAAKADTVTRPDPAEFKQFATAAARRFGAPTVMWSIWNEPNLPRFLKPQVAGGKNVAGRLYRDLYIAGRDGIRAGGQTTAPVLFGETAPVGGSIDERTYPLTFIRDALCVSATYKFDKSCGKLQIDGLSHHPYQFSAVKLNKNDVTYRALPRLATVLDKAARAGAVNTKVPVYLTEFGIQSYPDKIFGVSEQSQLEERARAEHLAWSNPRVKGFSQYLLQDDNPINGSFGGFESGLINYQGKEKLAYDGFRLVLDVKPGTSKKKTAIWGLVRAATGKTTVVVERRTGKKFVTWKKLKTDARGVFSTADAVRSKVAYRYRWTDAAGKKQTSPYVRPFKG